MLYLGHLANKYKSEIVNENAQFTVLVRAFIIMIGC